MPGIFGFAERPAFGKVLSPVFRLAQGRNDGACLGGLAEASIARGGLGLVAGHGIAGGKQGQRLRRRKDLTLVLHRPVEVAAANDTVRTLGGCQIWHAEGATTNRLRHARLRRSAAA